MRLVVTGGGTGGHIYPALTIARGAAAALGAGPILFVGARGGLEARLVPEAGFELTLLSTTGLIRKGPADAARALWHLGGAVAGAVRLLRRFRPDVVVGTGGYAAGPVGAAAIALRVPLVLQEQNVIPGVTNRLLARFAAAVAVPDQAAARYFPKGSHLVVSGNPVRAEVRAGDPAAARRRLGLPSGSRVVLLLAGSRGSAVFVRLFGQLLGLLPGAVILLVSGRAHHGAAVEAAAGRPGAVVVPYLDAIADGLTAADLVVCRAGGSTLAELAAVGRPAILIPSPHVTGHHQDANAAVFVQAGAAELVPEAGLDGHALAAACQALLANPERRAAMARRALDLHHPRALESILDAVARAAQRGGARGTR